MKTFSWLLLVTSIVYSFVEYIEKSTKTDFPYYIALIAMSVAGIASIFLMLYLVEDAQWNALGSSILSFICFIALTFISYYAIIILFIIGFIWFLSQLDNSSSTKYKKTGQIDIYEKDN